MTLIIADPALTAAPAPLAGSAARTRDLRAELADAIQNRRAAETIAADAKRLSDRGDRSPHSGSRANDRQRLPISGNS